MSNPNKVYQTPLIVVIKDHVVDVIHVSTPENCERDFIANVQSRVSNWDEYTKEDIDIILDNGYELTGNGSVCLTWVDKVTPEQKDGVVLPVLKTLQKNLQQDLDQMDRYQMQFILRVIRIMIDDTLKEVQSS
jgi:hypothetical protein